MSPGSGQLWFPVVTQRSPFPAEPQWLFRVDKKSSLGSRCNTESRELEGDLGTKENTGRGWWLHTCSKSRNPHIYFSLFVAISLGEESRVP